MRGLRDKKRKWEVKRDSQTEKEIIDTNFFVYRYSFFISGQREGGSTD